MTRSIWPKLPLLGFFLYFYGLGSAKTQRLPLNDAVGLSLTAASIAVKTPTLPLSPCDDGE